MMRRFLPLVMLGAALAAPTLAKPTASAEGRCDAACLSRLARDFMDGLANRGTAGKLPWAETVRYAENGVPMMVDDGIWQTVTAYGAMPLIVPDPTTGSVLWMGSIDEHGQPSFLALRLKADGRRISEAEEVIRRQQGRPPFGDPHAFAADPVFLAKLPAASRLPRDRMVALVQGYFNSVAANDGTILTRLSADCARSENGVVTTSGDYGPARLASGCEAQLRLGLFRDVERVRGLRFPVVDEERGLVVALGDRDYSGRQANLATTDGRAFAPDARFPHSYAFVAVFKLNDSAISRIAEISSSVPYRMPSWTEQE